MCGFFGFINRTQHASAELEKVARNCSELIAHRGPDGSDIWLDADASVVLAHRRLAILDPSPAGKQPMLSRSGRYVIAFNGEIYNHLQLRGALQKQGHVAAPWRGHSDTETLLACIDAWGLEKALSQCVGMFAIALWDRAERSLTLVRDRLGEKPLYFGWQGQGEKASFLFGSDLAALRQHPSFVGDVNRNALASFMRHNCIGGELSIYTGIYKLAPGCLLTVSRDAPEPAIRTWWSGALVSEKGVTQPFLGTADEAVNVLHGLLKEAVSQQMVADVPLGAFLSGGIDSSTVVALMQSQSSRPVRTFSIGFHERGFNEAEHAKAVARYLGTDHTELYVSPGQAMAVIPKLPSLYSEPFADSSQIPTYLVSQLARQHVTVSLSGDAGDELFCGYTRYQMASRLWGKVSCFPRPLRQLASKFITGISPRTWDMLDRVLPVSHLGDKLHKGAVLLDSKSMGELYQGLVSHWRDTPNLVLGANQNSVLGSGQLLRLQGLNDIERMMAWDMLGYLPDDILTKVDRAAMGVSLETRVPFLDRRVVEFAWTLPLSYKLRGGVTKWPLRQVLYRYVPQKLIERPKMGFGVPIGHWLRGPLREWAESLLAENRLASDGFFDPKPIRRKWAEHLSGRRNWQYDLWNVLMFQAWLKEQHT